MTSTCPDQGAKCNADTRHQDCAVQETDARTECPASLGEGSARTSRCHWHDAQPHHDTNFLRRRFGHVWFALRKYTSSHTAAVQFTRPVDERRCAVLSRMNRRSRCDESDGGGNASHIKSSTSESTLHLLSLMEAKPSMAAIRVIGWLLCKAWESMFSKVWVNEDSVRELRKLLSKHPEATVLLLPTHKSHVDYLVLSWVTFRYNLPMPFIAAGDNLSRIPVIGEFFRRCGAFYIRRGGSKRDRTPPNHGLPSSNTSITEVQSPKTKPSQCGEEESEGPDTVEGICGREPRAGFELPSSDGESDSDATAYRGILKNYVASLVRERAMIEFFVEGGRSRNGRVSRPQLGLLTYALEAALSNQHYGDGNSPVTDEDTPRKLILIPASIDYDFNPDLPSFARARKKRSQKAELGRRKRWRLVRNCVWAVHHAVVWPMVAGLNVAAWTISQVAACFLGAADSKGRFGNCYVNFSTPRLLTDIRSIAAEASDYIPRAVADVGATLHRALVQSTVVTASGLVAAAILWSPPNLSLPTPWNMAAASFFTTIDIADIYQRCVLLVDAVRQLHTPVAHSRDPIAAGVVNPCNCRGRCVAQLHSDLGCGANCIKEAVDEALRLLEQQRALTLSKAGHGTVVASGEEAQYLLDYCAGQVAVKFRCVFHVLAPLSIAPTTSFNPQELRAAHAFVKQESSNSRNGDTDDDSATIGMLKRASARQFL